MQISNITTVNIGKNGLTPEILKHLKKLLEQKKIIKIKFLKTAQFTDEELISLPGKIVKKIGRTIIIEKKQ
ncbi:hypothetical protein COX58_00655 [archaeon CG_4_10_14_0_2_um_filter_Archaea_38_6]|nr:MAG: hypothetical protein COS83_04920 [archaeon CG07_land_8_20_14_0_80_38_8]PIU88649.1 MAG: hypothetical protein COS64_03380 [archaeon CG06_land_8_20_14_3_00_37_11]PIX43931.1 MAG: hypothetical protein COZ55_00780 [archaeon CG_4_8_14_3_um_filter_38_5]PJA23024.1 MAG: hypothetical protein COX58_00655 [archaeon CG_4_10_14_0_2_um_filter_Archaea_38_6]